MIQDISEEEIRSVSNSIMIGYGIDFTCYEPNSLRRRIIRLMNKYSFGSIQDMWIRFLTDSAFIHIFMNEISVGMTSMFRDPILWRSLKSRLESEYHTKPVLKTWHAGCSTGEEVYSFGILLKESRMLHKAKVVVRTSIKMLSKKRSGLFIIK